MKLPRGRLEIVKLYEQTDLLFTNHLNTISKRFLWETDSADKKKIQEIESLGSQSFVLVKAKEESIDYLHGSWEPHIVFV